MTKDTRVPNRKAIFRKIKGKIKANQNLEHRSVAHICRKKLSSVNLFHFRDRAKHRRWRYSPLLEGIKNPPLWGLRKGHRILRIACANIGGKVTPELLPRIAAHYRYFKIDAACLQETGDLRDEDFFVRGYRYISAAAARNET